MWNTFDTFCHPYLRGIFTENTTSQQVLMWMWYCCNHNQDLCPPCWNFQDIISCFCRWSNTLWSTSLPLQPQKERIWDAAPQSPSSSAPLSSPYLVPLTLYSPWRVEEEGEVCVCGGECLGCLLGLCLVYGQPGEQRKKVLLGWIRLSSELVGDLKVQETESGTALW